MDTGKAALLTIGAFTGGFITYLWITNSKNSKFTARYESDDNCSSLFYNTNILESGRGLPYVKSCDEKEIVALTTVQPEYKKLSSDLYQKAVEYLPIVCVDVICQRKSDGKLLLFLRRDKPAANIWW